MDIFSLLSDDSGRWGRGGLFTALEVRSAEPRKIYELAGKMEGKKQRRGGEAQGQRGHLKRRIGWLRVHCKMRSASHWLPIVCEFEADPPQFIFSYFESDTVSTFPGAVVRIGDTRVLSEDQTPAHHPDYVPRRTSGLVEGNRPHF